MKKVFLVGDSIRKGYCEYVKEKLSGEAEVCFVEENSRFAQYVLRYISSWASNLGIGEDVDLVHWNAGLWDALEMFGDEPLTPPDFYRLMLVRTTKRIKRLFPNAKIVFALTTSVDESRMHPDSIRRNEVIREYNKIAVDALTEYGVVFNDLYSVTEGCDPECRSDGVHFNCERGVKMMGEAVTEFLRRELSL